MEYIAKTDLIVGAYYEGLCRNATVARWDGKKFVHWRSKFGHSYIERICCPEDDSVYDVFKARKRIDNPDVEIPLE